MSKQLRQDDKIVPGPHTAGVNNAHFCHFHVNNNGFVKYANNKTVSEVHDGLYEVFFEWVIMFRKIKWDISVFEGQIKTTEAEYQALLALSHEDLKDFCAKKKQ